MAPKLLNILLQRNDSNIQWGFKLSGGKDLAKPLTIVKVLPGTLASQYFVSGDIVLGIQGYSAKDLLHVEAIELVRDPGKSLELLVQKCDVPLDNQNNELPTSIWGPESVLQRPSEWLRRSPSPFARNLIDPKPPEVGYRSLNTLKQHFESVNQNSTQPDQIVRTGYTPTALDSKLKQQFELNEQTGYEQTMGVTQPISEIKQVQMVNQVSSVTQHMSCGSPLSQDSQFDRHVYHEEKNKHISYNIQETNQSSEELQENIGTTLEYQQNTSQKSSNTTIVEQKASNQTCTVIQKNTAITNVSNRIENVTEKQRIPSTADILKRPISPEFNMFPNSKGGSLLKLVLSKSLGNYSPHDFEKMRATETYEESDDGDDEDEDEDSETSEEEEEDEDEEATEEEDGGDNDCESQEEYIRYMSCDSDVALSSPGGSVVFDRYWMAENDDGALSDDSELAQQCPRSPSLSRNSSRASAASPYPDDRGRQSSQLSGGDNTPSPGPPSAPASGDGVTENTTAPSFPAPPPPPPPAPGTIPTVRLNTEIPDTRKSGGYEPPAAIQNAMMTKDKKPFTYTPGGLDLSQIRSPRMQRRITRNANAEGVGEHPQAAGPKTSPLAQPPPQGPLPPSAVAAMQPQMAVPVFPTGGSGSVHLHHVNAPPGNAPPPPPPPPGPTAVEPPPVIHPVSNTIPKTTTPVIRPVQSPMPKTEPPKPVPTIAKSPPVSPPTQMQNEPGSIYVPPVTTRAQVGSLYIPPITNNTQQEPVTSPQRQQTPQTPMSPLPTLNKAPTPWMSQHQRQQQQQQQNVPPWMHREEQQQQTAGATRIIPIQVEGRNEPVQPPQPQQAPHSQASNQSQTRIIPIQIEGASTTTNSTSNKQTTVQQQRRPVYVHNKFNPPTSPTSPAPNNHTDSQSEHNARQYQHQQSWGPSGGNGGPIQSRSFRVLQKITDTDNTESESELPAQEYGPPSSGGGHWNSQGVPVQQMHKLQLNEDDRALMNKFRAQVDEDSFLHTESDPRYRGAAIPSRAFRMLQNMTDGMADYGEQVPRGPGMSGNPQARPVQQVSSGDGSPQAYIPPSEQQVQEPRKYTGGAIPSRSFRMLQAMTAPENCGPGQSDM